MFGLGIPTIRPKYVTELSDPLIPNYHYVSIDVEFDAKYKYVNHEQISKNIAEKYLEVINNDEYLNYISSNAREWYVKNISSKNITNNLIKLLEL